MDNVDLIIDHIDGHILDNNKGRSSNELYSLDYLSQGLWFLYDWVSHIEAPINEQNRGKRVLYYGNGPDLAGVPQAIVACAFNWYAVTICNYVKLVGWLAYNGDSEKAGEYLRKVVPQVQIWRNKVAAHFCLIDPRKDDNPADLAMSVMFPISFDDDAFYTGSLKLTLTSGGETSTSREDIRWSLTHIHRELIPRYWPAGKPS